MTLQELYDSDFFTRTDYLSAIRESNTQLSEEALVYRLRDDASKGRIIRVGRNQYTFPGNKQDYAYSYSEEAVLLADEIRNDYPDAFFQIFELIQLNAFVNHLFAHNTIFIFVENELIDYVFDTLRRNHPGRVMLKPSLEHYYRYLVENQIVILRLPSESPENETVPWQSRLEKILVDISVDKLLSGIVSAEERETIFRESLDRYYLDVKAMFRYARRKGALDKFKDIYQKYTSAEMEGQ